MTDETTPDREALVTDIVHLADHAMKGVDPEHREVIRLARNRLIDALPAPHPQGGTDNEVVRLRSALIRNFAEQDRLRVLLHGIKALCDQADFVWRTWPWRSHVATSEVRALLAAAPAPTGMDPVHVDYVIQSGEVGPEGINLLDADEAAALLHAGADTEPNPAAPTEQRVAARYVGPGILVPCSCGVLGEHTHPAPAPTE